MKTIKIETSITLTEGEWKILETLHTTPQYTDGSTGWWEFRGKDNELDRSDARSLDEKGMLEMNEDAWHETYGLTDFGKEIYNKIK